MNNFKSKLDQIAHTYHQAADVKDKFIEDIQQEYSWELMKKWISPKTHVLELGYGEGIITQKIAQTKCHLTLIEGSSKLVEVATKQFASEIATGQMKVIERLFEEFEPKIKFDLILANHVLEHVDDPTHVLKAMKRWLNPRGHIFAIVPNADSLHRRLGVHMGLQTDTKVLSPRDHQVGHQRVYSYSEVEQDFRRAGLKIKESGGYFFKPFSNGMMIDFSPELIRGFLQLSKHFQKELLANLYVVATHRS
jgi:2-polyprenyl-3-methyl-5-hydroxy-6-metoxy-1,4-benzoquinol methylase